MDGSTPKDNISVLSSPFSSANVSALLKIKIISWSQETGLPASVCVRVGDRLFNLHKYPLFSKSGYFNRELTDSNEVVLPQDFPGGPETFEMISLFVYGSSTLVDPFNVASLRCAAEFLEMTEEYTSGNLCERFDIYLNQVVLQSWEDTLIVLQKCQSLDPWAEELLIVSRCIESLAFMACMEILDPERRRDQSVVTLEALSAQRWSSEMVQEILTQDVWIKDLMALPFGFFKRVIGSLRRQGMKEKYVSPVVLFYANSTLFDENGAKEDVSCLLKGILDLLQIGEKGSRVIPVGFYFRLLSESLKLKLDKEYTLKLQNQISGALHMGRVEDFLLPESGIDDVASSIEMTTMESIFSTYVVFHLCPNNGTPSPYNSVVAELWDAYLTRIASDAKIHAKRFMELIELMPISCRQNHDNLYKALNIFLQVHTELSQDEKSMVCKYLNCQKLSNEVCIEAVQNELMPLRLIVQALFVQQLSTHKALKECSDSFRYAHCGDFSGSIPSSRFANSRSQNLVESPCFDVQDTRNQPLSFLLQNDSEKPEFCKKEYESTSFRIQTLEQQLMVLKRSIQLQNTSKKREQGSKKVDPVRPYGLEGRTMSKKRTPLGQVTSCIGTVNLASQRRYASRLLNVFRRFSLFGRAKAKKKPSVTGVWPKPM
ncbi:putative BTB/POZ domain, NPH3 domain, NPH3/RPT2-like family protein [Helianthus annuus]|uniref:BTB/POZ domain-containing protein At5g48130 n=1 Tax=Helianthus annuus TaxID=4232 RepID=UPI000B907731|nr:BTB/POZ domain-containing protein At5g48130 [Helianthus annuus]KAJ0507771.1 putative BTB/POZ domain, NPH3 domain, NPH3/RPT2-like family protein [Helianthus annuus]